MAVECALTDSNLERTKTLLKDMIASCNMSAYDSSQMVKVSIERIIMQKFIASEVWDEGHEGLTDAAFDALKNEGLLRLNGLSEYTLTDEGIETLIQLKPQ